jgi:hypothetical protein
MLSLNLLQTRLWEEARELSDGTGQSGDDV